VLVLAVSYFAAVYLGGNLRFKMLVERIYLVSKRFFGAPTLYNLLFADKTRVNNVPKAKKPEFQLSFGFWEECG
jgi:hypothetical protein